MFSLEVPVVVRGDGQGQRAHHEPRDILTLRVGRLIFLRVPHFPKWPAMFVVVFFCIFAVFSSYFLFVYIKGQKIPFKLAYICAFLKCL